MMNRAATLSLLAGLTLAAPAAMAEPPRPVAAQVTHAAPTPSATDAVRYATRQAADHKAADFKGGDEDHSYVVVSVTGGTILIALIVLLILL